VKANPEKALAEALTMVSDDSLLVVTGSLYLVGGIRALLLQMRGGK